MGRFEKVDGGQLIPMVNSEGVTLVGAAAWRSRYSMGSDWSSFSLADKVGAFVEGGANFVSSLGMPLELAIGVIAVLVACFAATTLDTATRLQRYVIQELGTSFRIAPLTNKYVATFVAVALGLFVAMIPNAKGQYGQGGLILWPLFGATNQLLAGLAFMVLIFYLARRGRAVWFAVIPAVFMVLVPAYALLWNMFHEGGWFNSDQPNYLLTGFGCVILGLQAWMVAECLILFPKARGVLEEGLPPLSNGTNAPGQLNC